MSQTPLVRFAVDLFCRLVVVRQVFTRCRGIIAAFNACICKALLHSVSERQSKSSFSYQPHDTLTWPAVAFPFLSAPLSFSLFSPPLQSSPYSSHSFSRSLFVVTVSICFPTWQKVKQQIHNKSDQCSSSLTQLAVTEAWVG